MGMRVVVLCAPGCRGGGCGATGWLLLGIVKGGGWCCNMPGLVLQNAWLACKKCVVSAENQKHTISRWLAAFSVHISCREGESGLSFVGRMWKIFIHIDNKQYGLCLGWPPSLCHSPISVQDTVYSATRIKKMSLPYFDIGIVAGFPIPLDNDERLKTSNCWRCYALIQNRAISSEWKDIRWSMQALSLAILL